MNTDFVIAHERLRLRPVEADDANFLGRLYGSTRLGEMALVDWGVEQKELFLQTQFQAQTQHYRAYYPKADYQIVQREARIPIGRLIIDRSTHSILLIDIALLPEWRKAGIGTTLLRDLMAEAGQVNRPIILHVEVFNPALKLYNRLGFVKTDEQSIYYELVWKPSSHPAWSGSNSFTSLEKSEIC